MKAALDLRAKIATLMATPRRQATPGVMRNMPSESSLIVTALVCCTIAALVFMARFYANEWGGPTAWGEFGDYIGGLLNPVIAFLALILLARGVAIQKEELSETRIALDSQNTILKNTTACDALLKAAISVADEIDVILSTPRGSMPYVLLGNEDTARRVTAIEGASLNELFDMAPHLCKIELQPYSNNRMPGFRDLLEKLNEKFSILADVLDEIDYRKMDGHSIVAKLLRKKFFAATTSMHLFQAMPKDLAIRFGADVALTR